MEENSHIPPQIERIAAMSTTAPLCPQNKLATKWAHKIPNCQTGIIDTDATSGAAAKRDIKALENTGLPSTEVFMLPDKSKIRSTQKMLMKHKLREGARDKNVVPGLHSAPVSIPKMANADYIMVYDKRKLPSMMLRLS
jgi:hypothetical protein